jgi:hypothetical protein
MVSRTLWMGQRMERNGQNHRAVDGATGATRAAPRYARRWCWSLSAISKTGAKSWVLRYRIAGGRHDMGLGNLDTVTLAEAREKARDARKLKAGGIDPLAAKRASRASLRAAAAKAMTFADCVESYVRDKRSGWRSVQYATQWRQALVDHVLPVIGTLPVSVIDTPLVLKTLRPIWDTHTVTASRIRARVELILDWARVYRDGENPARWRGHLDKLLPKPAKVKRIEHHAALPYPACRRSCASCASATMPALVPWSLRF